jgi:glycolate oxidase FAD binding subunit
MSDTIHTGSSPGRGPRAAAHPDTAPHRATPADVAEASALLRRGDAERRTLYFAGAGTKAQWGGEVEPADLTVSTAGLAGLISHQPGDMTAAVGAGMPLAQLQTLLARHGQWLALDPATEPDGATIGGLLATGDAGPRRLRYGTMRDLAIGATLVLADGTVAHSGSHVIKNVAGYDLTKLFHGSLGSLGLIAEVIVRLHPRPPASATVIAAASAAQANTAAAQLSRCGVEPSALEWIGPTGAEPAGTLLARIDASPAGVAAGTSRMAALLSTLGLVPHALDDTDGEEQWRRVAAGAAGGPADSVIRAGTRPDRLPEVADALARLADQHGVAATLVSSAALGLHTAVLSGAPHAQTDVARGWRRRIEELGGALSVRNRPAEVAAQLTAWPDPPSAVALLRAVKHRLDPHARCAPGRFRGWY